MWENITVQALVAQFVVEAFDIGILPWRAGREVNRPNRCIRFALTSCPSRRKSAVTRR
jgi:hypothetical protein